MRLVGHPRRQKHRWRTLHWYSHPDGRTDGRAGRFNNRQEQKRQVATYVDGRSKHFFMADAAWASHRLFSFTLIGVAFPPFLTHCGRRWKKGFLSFRQAFEGWWWRSHIHDCVHIQTWGTTLKFGKFEVICHGLILALLVCPLSKNRKKKNLVPLVYLFLT
ncbi:uncharacterized protein BKA78DRAFT_107300 [Phyllosticta capitalensis]|uniref:uncharacterized protein n=1 Tax=Phyllosticta capitalensis TaxID=121624 RepID=UPI00313104D5